jgi:hypothetical protein
MASILAWVAAYEAEVRAEGILAGQTAEPVLGVHWGGSACGRSKVTVEQTVSIRRSRSEGQEIDAIAWESGLSPAAPDRILDEKWNDSTGSCDAECAGKIDYGERSEWSIL